MQNQVIIDAKFSEMEVQISKSIYDALINKLLKLTGMPSHWYTYRVNFVSSLSVATEEKLQALKQGDGKTYIQNLEIEAILTEMLRLLEESMGETKIADASFEVVEEVGV